MGYLQTFLLPCKINVYTCVGSDVIISRGQSSPDFSSIAAPVPQPELNIAPDQSDVMITSSEEQEGEGGDGERGSAAAPVVILDDDSEEVGGEDPEVIGAFSGMLWYVHVVLYITKNFCDKKLS